MLAWGQGTASGQATGDRFELVSPLSPSLLHDRCGAQGMLPLHTAALFGRMVSPASLTSCNDIDDKDNGRADQIIHPDDICHISTFLTFLFLFYLAFLHACFRWITGVDLLITSGTKYVPGRPWYPVKILSSYATHMAHNCDMVDNIGGHFPLRNIVYTAESFSRCPNRDPAATSSSMCTSWLSAARRGRVVKHLVKRRLLVTHCDVLKITPLHLAWLAGLHGDRILLDALAKPSIITTAMNADSQVGRQQLA